MENLILSIVNKDYSDLDRFFISLTDTGYSGHTCIFAGPNSNPALMAKLAAQGVEIIRFETTFPYVADLHPDNFKALPDPIILYNYRYFLFYDYLLKNPGRFANVLLTDIRDVVFQRNPFDIITTDALYVALETSIIDGCPFTKSWIQAGYGEEMVDNVKASVLSCSGTTLGPTDRVLSYLKKMVGEMLEIRDAYNCYCQGIHNVLLNTGQLEPTVRLENEDGLIMTVGGHLSHTQLHQLRYDKQGYMLGKGAERAYIVHQFDRYLAIMLKLDKFIFKSHLPPALSKRHFGVGVFRFLAEDYYRKSPALVHAWRLLKRASGKESSSR